MATIYNNGVSASNANVVNDVYNGLDAIFRSDIIVAEGSNNLDGFYKGETEKRASQIKIDPELQELLLEDIGLSTEKEGEQFSQQLMECLSGSMPR